MNHRLWALAALALAACLVVAFAATATASARTTHSYLRVEGPDRTLEFGTNYSNGTVTTRNSSACGPRNSVTERIRGPKALNLIGHASHVNGRLRPFRTSDTNEEIGILVCQIGDYKGFGDRAWLYRVNHQFASVGGDQLNVGRSDEVLWYFANFSNGRNTGDELELRNVPVAVRPGDAFQVRVVAYDGGGNAAPREGARVTRALAPTRANGTTTVIARSTPGTMRLTAEHGIDVRAARVEVCVRVNLAACPASRGEDFVGTNRADLIVGTFGPDSVRARRGEDAVRSRGDDDTVNVRNGGRDYVGCGGGRDLVYADGKDRVDDCEKVLRG